MYMYMYLYTYVHVHAATIQCIPMTTNDGRTALENDGINEHQRLCTSH